MVSDTGADEITAAEAEFGSMVEPGETPARSEQVSSSQVVAKPERLSDAGEAKKGPPKLDEWQDFFARVVIRLFVNAWLAFALGDLIDDLSPMEF